MKEMVLTKAGLEKLKIELQDLKTAKRKEVRERIKTAKEYGDLSENSEYEDAKNQQSFIEGRIQEISEIIRESKIVDSKKNLSMVSIGDQITIKLNNEQEIYQIVGATESDPATGKISSESPIAQALLGHKIGDKVEFPTPDGKMECAILKIE